MRFHTVSYLQLGLDGVVPNDYLPLGLRPRQSDLQLLHVCLPRLLQNAAYTVEKRVLIPFNTLLKAAVQPEQRHGHTIGYLASWPDEACLR